MFWKGLRTGCWAGKPVAISQDWAHRSDLILEELIEADADLVLLQEVVQTLRKHHTWCWTVPVSAVYTVCKHWLVPWCFFLAPKSREPSQVAYEQLEELEARLASLGYSCVMQRPPLGVAGRGGVFRLED